MSSTTLHFDKTISIAKGICIILVVIGHCTPLGIANNFIIQFHVALFFFVSGYFFTQSKVVNPLEFIKKRVTGLYFPYLRYAIVFLLIHNLLVSLHIIPDHYNFSTWLYHLYLITTHFSGHDAMLGGFWFIKELFMVSIIYLFLRKYIARSTRQIIPTLFILLFMAIVMSKYKIEIPWLQITNQTMEGIILFGLGELSHKYNIQKLYNLKITFSILPIMVASASIGRYYFNSSGTGIIIFLILAVLGIYSCLSVSYVVWTRIGGGNFKILELCRTKHNGNIRTALYFI